MDKPVIFTESKFYSQFFKKNMIIDDQFNDIMFAVISNYNKKVREIFVRSLEIFAKPPIKGEITKGKLKWRGIVVCKKENGEIWIEQRGERISPIILTYPPKAISNGLSIDKIWVDEALNIETYKKRSRLI